MSLHVTLGNAAVVAAGLCSSLCDRAKEEYMSGQLGRDIKAKYMRLSQGPDRCFLCSSVQCLKHLSPGQVGGEFPFSWLIAEFRLLQDCVLPFLQAGQESSVIPLSPLLSLALNLLFLQVLLPPPGDIPPSPPGLQEQLDTVASFSTFKELLEVSS